MDKETTEDTEIPSIEEVLNEYYYPDTVTTGPEMESELTEHGYHETPP